MGARARVQPLKDCEACGEGARAVGLMSGPAMTALQPEKRANATLPMSVDSVCTPIPEKREERATGASARAGRTARSVRKCEGQDKWRSEHQEIEKSTDSLSHAARAAKARSQKAATLYFRLSGLLLL
eukprot:6180973-Pleurochrysis_carterae.AAC.8